MSKLQVEYVPVEKLEVNPHNPRLAPTSAILALKKSIEQFGWTNPVLVQKSTAMVIAGHQRIKAAKLAGLKEIPVIYLEFDDTKSLAYNIADNKLAELTGWDEKQLTRLLDELHDTIDLTELGFNKEELEQLNADLAADIKSFEEELDEAIASVETTGIVSPLYWIGGKNRLATWIMSHFPPHTCYVEPFGGAAAVLLRKPRCKSEVYNDINKFACEFFRSLRDNPRELLSNLAFMPHSRELYHELKSDFKSGDVHPDDMALRCACWFYVQHSSFAGQWAGDWGHGKSRSPPFQKVIGRLLEVALRLKTVQIENKDFRYIFKTYDSEETLFYVDPPYLKHEHYYKGQAEAFTLKDHKDLAVILNQIQGKACVSYYPDPFIDKAYEGWRQARKTVTAWSYGVTRTSKSGRRPKRTELLLMNY